MDSSISYRHGSSDTSKLILLSIAVISIQHSNVIQDSGTKHDIPDSWLGILVIEEQSENKENQKWNYICAQVNSVSFMNGMLEAPCYHYDHKSRWIRSLIINMIKSYKKGVF